MWAPELTLRPVLTPDDWRRKLELHQADDMSPDGHHVPAAEWVALERRKCDDGMEAYLAEAGGEIVGAVGAIHGEGILRMKNILDSPRSPTPGPRPGNASPRRPRSAGNRAFPSSASLP